MALSGRAIDLAPRLAGGSSGNGVGLAVLGQRLPVLGVDLEEMVEDDHEHGGAAEEDGERVELRVGDHGCGSGSGGGRLRVRGCLLQR